MLQAGFLFAISDFESQLSLGFDEMAWFAQVNNDFTSAHHVKNLSH